MLVNPYYHRGAIRQSEHFFGRTMEVRRAIEMLSQIQSVSLVGPRTIGKTSFLFHISNPETWRYYGLDPYRTPMIYISCEGLADLTKEALHGILLSEMLEHLPDVASPLRTTGRGLEMNSVEFFRNIEELITPNVDFVILLFDEFELLARNLHLDATFFSNLRALGQLGQIAYVVSTASPLFRLTYDHTTVLGSPFFNIFTPILLGLFSRREAYELITHPAETVGIHFPPEVTDLIYQLAGGHPFLIQIACYHAFGILASKGYLEEADYVVLREVVQREFADYFEYYWSHLTNEERLVLARISAGELTRPTEQIARAISELESKALVVVQDSSYTIFSTTFTEFVRARVRASTMGLPAQVGELYMSLQEVQEALDLEPQEFAGKAAYFVERLCERFDLTILSQPSLPNSRFHLFVLDTRSLFRGIRLPNILPLLFVQRDGLLESDLEEIRQCLSDEVGKAYRVALLALLGREPITKMARELLYDKLHRVYAYDVIPLNTSDFLEIDVADNPERELRKQILAHMDLITISPYIVTGPTSDDIFFGREHELREITESVGASSFAVIGGRRIGKSSLLGRLHRVRLPDAGFCSLYYDCSITPTYKSLLTTEIRDWCPQAPLNAPATFGDLLQGSPTDKPLVLLLDEADKLVPSDRAGGWRLFNSLRGLANSGRAQVVLGGERTLRDAMRDPKSPLFNFANQVVLGRLDSHAVGELVIRPTKQLEIELVGEGSIVQRIWDFTSGHPNVVQRLCRRLIEQLNEQGTRRITLDDVNSIIENPQFQEVDFLQTYWEAATPLEKIITLVLSREARAYHLKEVRQLLSEQIYIQPSATATKDALDRLVDLRSILRRSQDGYAFAVEAFPRVLASTTTVEDLLEVLVEQYQQTEAQV